MKIVIKAALGAAIALAGTVHLSGCDAADPRVPFDAENATYEEQIIHAVQTGDIEKVKNFLASQPDLATMHDSAGRTLLHHAAMGSQIEVAQLLLDNAADINAQGFNMETPLDAAIGAEASPEMIRFLEERGAID